MTDYSKQEKYKKIILNYLKDNPELDNQKIAELLIINEGIQEDVNFLKDVIGSVRRSDELVEIDTESEDLERWEVVEGNYIINAKKGDIKLTVEQVDQLFYEYSKKGLNLTQEAVRRKHNIKIWEWHALKRALWLYKDSDIFSPWTFDNTKPGDLKDMIADRLEFKENDKRRLVEEEHDKILKRNFNKSIDEINRKEYAFRKIVDELSDVLPHVKISPLKRTEIKDGLDPKILVVPIADIHIGAEVRDLKMTPEFNLEIAREYLKHTAEFINKQDADAVHIAFLGDIIESFTGLNHKNSWKSIAYGMYGSKVITNALEIIEEFLGNVNNVVAVYGVAGNHDRSTSNNKEDDRGEIAETIFYMLDRIYGPYLPIEYDPLVISKEIDGINYLFTHGDKKVIKKDPRDFIFEYGRTDIFNLVFTGHLHNRQVPKDTAKYRWVICPSIFSGNWYSEQNGWHAKPGFVTSQNNGYKLPLITDHTLPVDTDK